jgi:hypothetical protein
MSYVKLFTTVSDHAVGIQSVNQAVDNAQALYDQFDLRHAAEAGALGGGDVFLQVGKHDDIRVSRTVIDFKLDAAASPMRLMQLLTGRIIGGTIVRQSAGVWKIPVTSDSMLGVVGTAKATAAGYRHVGCTVSREGGGPSFPDRTYITARTWNILTGAPEDFDFSLVIWAPSVG